MATSSRSKADGPEVGYTLGDEKRSDLATFQAGGGEATSSEAEQLIRRIPRAPAAHSQPSFAARPQPVTCARDSRKAFPLQRSATPSIAARACDRSLPHHHRHPVRVANSLAIHLSEGVSRRRRSARTGVGGRRGTACAHGISVARSSTTATWSTTHTLTPAAHTRSSPRTNTSGL